MWDISPADQGDVKWIQKIQFKKELLTSSNKDSGGREDLFYTKESCVVHFTMGKQSWTLFVFRFTVWYLEVKSDQRNEEKSQEKGEPSGLQQGQEWWGQAWRQHVFLWDRRSWTPAPSLEISLFSWFDKNKCEKIICDTLWNLKIFPILHKLSET